MSNSMPQMIRHRVAFLRQKDGSCFYRWEMVPQNLYSLDKAFRIVTSPIGSIYCINAVRAEDVVPGSHFIFHGETGHGVTSFTVGGGETIIAATYDLVAQLVQENERSFSDRFEPSWLYYAVQVLRDARDGKPFNGRMEPSKTPGNFVSDTFFKSQS